LTGCKEIIIPSILYQLLFLQPFLKRNQLSWRASRK